MKPDASQDGASLRGGRGGLLHWSSLKRAPVPGPSWVTTSELWEAGDIEVEPPLYGGGRGLEVRV